MAIDRLIAQPALGVCSYIGFVRCPSNANCLLHGAESIVLFNLLVHHKVIDEAGTVFGGKLCVVLSRVMRCEVDTNAARTQVKDSITNWAVHCGALSAAVNIMINMSLTCLFQENSSSNRKHKLSIGAASTSLYQSVCLLEALTSFSWHAPNPVPLGLTEWCLNCVLSCRCGISARGAAPLLSGSSHRDTWQC